MAKKKDGNFYHAFVGAQLDNGYLQGLDIWVGHSPGITFPSALLKYAL